MKSPPEGFPLGGLFIFTNKMTSHLLIFTKIIKSVKKIIELC